ncbi:MAG TPA: AraC family transcriptional regulator [Polyangiaceae bacterium]|jgi:AraC-like DNA-binding protein
MIRSLRTVRAPALAASLSNAALIHTRLRLHAVENERVVNEDMLLLRAYGRSGRVERPVITVLLEGEARVSAHGRNEWLSPGDVIAVDSKGEVRMRQAGAKFASLAFEWEPGFVGGRGGPVERWRAPDRALARLREVWTGLRGDGDPAALVEALLAVLAELGAPVEPKPARELDEPPAPHAQDITRALDRVLSNLEGQPMMLDLQDQLHLSPRQLNRVIAEYNERYGFNSSGWIDTRNRRRLMFGATFMTVPDAVAREVAGVVGYRSAAAFTRALRMAGLPPPSAIAAEVEQIARALK